MPDTDSPPQHISRHAWPGPLKRWLSRRRQIVETAFAKWQQAFRLRADRPRDLTGAQARLAAAITLHNFCDWLNRQLGRPPLAFGDLLAWQELFGIPQRAFPSPGPGPRGCRLLP